MNAQLESQQRKSTLDELAALAAGVDGEDGRTLMRLCEHLRSEWRERQADHEALANAQAEALVNSAMIMNELEKTQRDLEQARLSAEEASRAKSEFLANMSHEIRTPINAVLGMNEILLRTQLSERQRHCATTVRSSVESLLGVINNILDFSRIEAGKLELHAVAFDLRDLIEDLAGLYADAALARGVELNTLIPAGMHTRFVSDDQRLRQVLTNLIGNALKFTGRGEVVVEVLAPPDPADGQPLVGIRVRDTGIGIAPEACTRIFDAFAQADGTTQRSYGGTGLGLAISAELVSIMGGEIGVDSEPGRGSTFWITLPLRRCETVPAADAQAASLNGMRVLAVDDNETNLDIYRDQLTHWQCDFDTASDGPHALAALRLAADKGRPFELVILDMHMPGMDGLALARHITGDPAIPRPRQVLLSSISDEISADDYKGAGIECHLSKPVRQGELHSCLRRHRGNAAGAGAGEAATPQPDQGFAGHVLVAEDNLLNQEVAVELLALAGVSADTVTDGAQALEAIHRRRYDLVLMDCQMPTMDGLQATRAIRAHEADCGLARTPIIALTANALADAREQCLAAGMDDYLGKPFSDAGLRAVLARWLPAGADARPVDSPQAMADAPGIPASTDPAPAPLNFDALAHFERREREGRRGILRRVVSSYLDQSREQVQRMLTAAETGDVDQAAFCAHALKSSSAVVGADQLSLLCQEVEEAARIADLSTLWQCIPEAARNHERVCSALLQRYPEAGR